MAFFKADEQTLAVDKWPNGIGRVIREREKVISKLKLAQLVPCDISDIPAWLCVERQPELGRAMVLYRNDIESGREGEGVQVALRLQGIILDMNLGLGGSWDGTLENIFKAQQVLTLVGGGCSAAFAPQERSLSNIRKVVLNLLGKTGMGEYGRLGSISLRKRVFTKVMETEDGLDEKISVVQPAEDPGGQLRRYHPEWHILERLQCGKQEADRSLRPLDVALLNQGDFVDVLVTLTVPLTRGRVGVSGDLMIEPKRILRLRTSTQIADLLRLPA